MGGCGPSVLYSYLVPHGRMAEIESEPMTEESMSEKEESSHSSSLLTFHGSSYPSKGDGSTLDGMQRYRSVSTQCSPVLVQPRVG